MAASPCRLWLDCDPGHDDALALILAACSPSLSTLVGVSTTFGNTTVANATRNALRVLHAAGVAGVPVHRGAAKPLVRAAVHCPEIHGHSGLDGPELDDGVQEPSAVPAVLAMHAALSAGEVTLVATGPLTNVALLLSVYPDLIPTLRVVWMGGSLGTGNTGAVAEFNAQLDPEACRCVFEAGVRELVMIPLGVTHSVLVRPAVLDAIGTASAFQLLIRELLLFFSATYKETFGFHEGPPLHDPVAVAYALAPALFATRRLRIDIETGSSLSYGQTVADVWKQNKLPANCTVSDAVDVDAFWRLMHAALQHADAHSPLNKQ